MATSWDFDGVITTGRYSPQKGDVIVTGRCHDESYDVFSSLFKLGIIGIPVYFNTMTLDIRGNYTEASRIKSGYHKVDMLRLLMKNGGIDTHVDDDPIQLQIIKSELPDLKLIHVINEKGDYYGSTEI